VAKNAVPSEATEEQDTSDWLTHAEVARIIGRTVPTVRRLRIEGELTAVFVEGVWRFDPERVTEVAKQYAAGDGTLSSIESAKRLHSTEVSLTSVVETLVENHQKLFDTLFKVVDRHAAYIERLEDSNQKMRETAEVAATLEHLRETERRKVASDDALRSKALASLTQYALPFFAAKMGFPMPTPATNGATHTNGTAHTNGGVDDGVKVKLADQILTILATLDDATVAKMKDILPPDQAAMLANLAAATRGT
jgi:hypothetical protein